MPRRDDVRRLGQPRPRRVHPDHPPRARRAGSTSSTPPTYTREASRRRSSARRSPAASATTSCSRPRSTGRWATTPTSSATPAGGSSREVENSLRRLRTDWIDLYQIHRPEADTDIDETLGALTDLVRAGKVRYIGSSTFPAEPDRRGPVGRAERRGRERFVCEQPPYSILVRGVETDVLPTVPAPRHGRDPVEPARRRLADRALPQGRRAARLAPRGADPGSLRHVAAREPAQARGRRRARQAGRGGRDRR